MPAVIQEPQASASPFEKLNEDFRNKNLRLEELISRLRDKGHKLSNTNVPQNDAKTQASSGELPFRDGHLMYYYDHLTRNEYLLMELMNEVNKIESLI